MTREPSSVQPTVLHCRVLYICLARLQTTTKAPGQMWVPLPDIGTRNILHEARPGHLYHSSGRRRRRQQTSAALRVQYRTVVRRSPAGPLSSFQYWIHLPVINSDVLIHCTACNKTAITCTVVLLLLCSMGINFQLHSTVQDGSKASVTPIKSAQVIVTITLQYSTVKASI